MKSLLSLLACLLLWSQLAWGHASLLSAVPAPGAVLEQAPNAIVLTFNEPVGITIMRLFDPHGKQIPIGTILDQDKQIHIPVPRGGPQGTYLLSWRIVSADGHPVGGTLDYSVGAPSAQTAALSVTGTSSRDAAIWLTRWLTYLCLFAAAGAALFRSLYPDRRQTWAWIAIAAGALLLPMDLGLQGLDLRDVPWPGLMDPATWSAALASIYTKTLGLDALVLLLAAGMLRCQVRGFLRWAGVVALVLAGTAASVSGHAGTAPPQWLSRPAVTLHVMLAIAWIGTLLPLSHTLRAATIAPLTTHAAGPAHEPLRILADFSRRITVVVVLLAASGLLLAYLQLNYFSDLWKTPYGRVLIAKLTLVALLLCVAAYNRWRLTRPVLSGSTTAVRRLRLAIRVELGLAVLILAVVSLWRLTPPPRSLDAGDAIISAATLTDSRARVQVNPGSSAWNIRLERPTSGVFPAQGVTLVLSNPAAGIEPIRRPAKQQSPGLWQAIVPRLPTVGKWQIEVDILVDDFDQLTLKTNAAPPGRAGNDHSHAAMPGMKMPGM